jgi:hypothetical protein
LSEILIGVSACLLGEHVRYDGGHKRNAFLLEELASHVRFVPVCPEVGIGLRVPREAIRLVERHAGESTGPLPAAGRADAGREHGDKPRRGVRTPAGLSFARRPLHASARAAISRDRNATILRASTLSGSRSGL